MKTIGLIGGMSWESSAEYYRILNQRVRDRLGPTASARCSVWFRARTAGRHSRATRSTRC